MQIQCNHFNNEQWRVSITNHRLAVTDKKHVAYTGQFPGSGVGFITRLDANGNDVDLTEAERLEIVEWVKNWQAENAKKREEKKAEPKA